MDRAIDNPGLRSVAAGPGRAGGQRDEFIPPSRRHALDLLIGVLDLGPVLVTGDAGIGKTWLWQRAATESGHAAGWVEVDVTPADDPASFLRSIAHGLGLGPRDGRPWGRTDLADALAERAADGDRPVLVVEEAHNLSASLAEEVRVLANRLGRPDGFAGLVLVGQTGLAFRMNTRPMAAIEARLAARVHLLAIDADEARELMARHRPDPRRSAEQAERAHRDAGGNPRRLLRAMAAIDPRPRQALASAPAPAPATAFAPEPAPPTARPAPEPLTGPDRPPLRVEDGLIEVGWSPEDPAPGLAAGPAALLDDETQAAPPEEAVHDHYAALQAWREWADNQSRRELAEIARRPRPATPVDDIDEETDPDPDAGVPHVWVDGKDEFAPFGSLFGKIARASEAD